MNSSIIKAVTHTQFETCVTAFIALDFEKVVGLEFEIISKLDSYFLMAVLPRMNSVQTSFKRKWFTKIE